MRWSFVAGCCVVLVGHLLAFNAYVFVLNVTNHTGLPLGGLKWGFGCCAAAAAALGPAALRGSVARGWWWALLAVALLGLANIVAFERSVSCSNTTSGFAGGCRVGGDRGACIDF